MKTEALVCLLLISSTLAVPVSETRESRIVGGVNAVPGEFPFIVSMHWVLLTLSTHVCGGSILNNIWVLSAAHCFTETPGTGRLEIIAGLHSQANLGEGFRHAIDRPRSIIHPDYVAGGGVGPDDLVLVRLTSPLSFNARVTTIRLPVAGTVPTGPGTLAGWGSTGGTGGATILQKATKATITLAQCRAAIHAMGFDGNLVDDSNLCTGPLTGGVSACSGDSGGPLIQAEGQHTVIIGVVSWGFTPCGSVGAPSGVYKRVSHYIDWIFAHTGIQN